jgi:glutathione peroxidase
MLSLFLLFSIVGIAQKSVYEFKLKSIDGKKIDFNNLRNKLIVVVNIASGSERHVQLRQLDTLCRNYESQGLVVVVFPTNDFNHESKSDNEIRSWTSGLHQNLLIGERTSVKGESRSDFYQWCTKKSENGSLEMEVRGDFQKFIISKEGKMVGVFSGALSPLAEPFTQSIETLLKG